MPEGNSSVPELCANSLATGLILGMCCIWKGVPSCLANSSSPILARMIFCSVVMVSSNRRGAPGHHLSD
jgi:hypothetical protein